MRSNPSQLFNASTAMPEPTFWRIGAVVRVTGLGRCGITSRQDSSGGKTKLGRITRRGDTYLRSLLVQRMLASPPSPHKPAKAAASDHEKWALTFDMRGGRKWAKPACGRPLDGRVRPRVRGKPLRCCARPDQ